MQQVTVLAKDLLASDDPYEVALEIHGISAHASTEFESAGSVYLIWGELTDWMELKTEENEQAEAEMVRAAREWLSLDPANREAVARYLDYWVHDVCGYARPTKRLPSRPSRRSSDRP